MNTFWSRRHSKESNVTNTYTHTHTHTHTQTHTSISGHAQLLQSCPALCHPMDYSPPGSSVLGILQARILEWVAMPSSRGSSQSSDWTCIFCGSCVAGWFFTAEHWGSTLNQAPHRVIWELSDSEEKCIKHLSQCQAYYMCVCAQSLSHIDSLRPHGL